MDTGQGDIKWQGVGRVTSLQGDWDGPSAAVVSSTQRVQTSRNWPHVLPPTLISQPCRLRQKLQPRGPSPFCRGREAAGQPCSVRDSLLEKPALHHSTPSTARSTLYSPTPCSTPRQNTSPTFRVPSGIIPVADVHPRLSTGKCHCR